ncbi:hypothetical protein B0H14DRAFT_3460173 [Mycena olivaceomarginata]|nr:hypothetical protein B0H14DRAFT_3460173 [Mycena olivaceomarginata]
MTAWTLARFRGASLQEILDVSRARDTVHAAQVKHELNMEVVGEGGGAEEEEALLRSVEEEERALLSGVARVQSRLFEGALVERAKAPKQRKKRWRVRCRGNASGWTGQ